MVKGCAAVEDFYSLLSFLFGRVGVVAQERASAGSAFAEEMHAADSSRNDFHSWASAFSGIESQSRMGPLASGTHRRMMLRTA